MHKMVVFFLGKLMLWISRIAVYCSADFPRLWQTTCSAIHTAAAIKTAAPTVKNCSTLLSSSFVTDSAAISHVPSSALIVLSIAFIVVCQNTH